MKIKGKAKKELVSKKVNDTVDETCPDSDADKTGTDKNADCTVKSKGINKFDKPKTEPNPDSTSKEINTPKPKRKILK
jgi:hypothetical protein